MVGCRVAQDLGFRRRERCARPLLIAKGELLRVVGLSCSRSGLASRAFRPRRSRPESTIRSTTARQKSEDRTLRALVGGCHQTCPPGLPAEFAGMAPRRCAFDAGEDRTARAVDPLVAAVARVLAVLPLRETRYARIESRPVVVRPDGDDLDSPASSLGTPLEDRAVECVAGSRLPPVRPDLDDRRRGRVQGLRRHG